MEEMEVCEWFGQGGKKCVCSVKMKVVRRGIYRVRERGWPCMRGWIWEGNGLNLNGEVGGVL